MVIAVDFDGTCVTHEYPFVGKDIGAVPVLKKIVENGHQIILLTMRDGDTLKDAEKWFADNEIPLLASNNSPNAPRSISRKVFATIYIDDMALGCPLMYVSTYSNRPFVNWNEVQKWLLTNEIIK